MDRRELLMLGGLALADTATPGSSMAQVQPAAAWTSFLHIWTDANGVSHAEHVPVAAKVKSVPITQMFIRSETDSAAGWRNSANSQFVATLDGELEVEASDGTRLKLPPSRLAFLEDTTGKGHISRTKKVLNFHMYTAPGFDVRAWARGEA